MTEFGDQVKKYMSIVDSSEVTSRPSIVKKEKKRTTYGYTFEVSGIDFIAHKFVSDKETMTLVCFLSKQNDEGKPVCFIQEKGKNLIVDAAVLRTFLNGLTHVEDFPNKIVKVMDKDGNVCESVPCMYADGKNSMDSFIECFLFMIDTPKFIEHVRMGIINLDILYKSCGRSSIRRPWFISSDVARYGAIDFSSFKMAYTPMFSKKYDEDKGEFVDDKKSEYSYRYLYENNIHSKLFKAAISYSSEVTGYNKAKVLDGFYSNTDEGMLNRKNLTMNIFLSFLILANRYDEPFAIGCMKNYFTNARLGNIDSDALNQLLCMDISRYKDRTGHVNNQLGNRYGYYGGVNITTVRADLRSGPLPPNMKDLVLNLDKNRMWDYIMEASAKAYGKKLKEYINYWSDHIGTQYSYYGTLKDKYPEHLIEDHMILNEKYNEYLSFIEDSYTSSDGTRYSNRNDALFKATELASEYCDMKEGKWNFHIFRKVEEFLEEASYMGNCLASCDYAGKVINRTSWVGVLRSNEDDKSLIDVEIDPNTGKMIQIYSRYDHYPIETDEMWDEMKALKKIQDKIYKKFLDNGYNVFIEYDKRFDPLIEKKKAQPSS